MCVGLGFLVFKSNTNGFNTSVSRVLQKNAKVVTIDGYEDVPKNNEAALKKALANQPISFAIKAGGHALQLYSLV